MDASTAAQIAHLEFRRDELKAKAERLANIKPMPGHDLPAAKESNKKQLQEIESELARLKNSTQEATK